MAMGKENCRDARQADGSAGGSDQEERFSSDPVNHGHGNHGEEQIGCTDHDGLEISGKLAVSGKGENVIQVIEDGVDAGELIEHSNAYGEENRERVLFRKQRLLRLVAFEVDGLRDVLHFLIE